MIYESIGAGCFGIVVGWVTYRTLRRAQAVAISDIAAVVGAVGGAAVVQLFPGQTNLFASYAIGLFVGFFSYLITASYFASRSDGGSFVAEWLGLPEAPDHVPPPPRSRGGGGVPPIPDA